MTLAIAFQGALIVACLAVSLYCHILSRRLRKLNDLETGLGGAIAVMAAEVARLEAAIAGARDEAERAARALATEVEHARDERMRLRLGQDLGEGAAPLRARRLRRRAPDDAPAARGGYDA